MLTLEQAKNLNIGDQVVVTRTKEVWSVTGIAPVDSVKKVKILINKGGAIDSYFDESRLHLFDLYETPSAPSNLPSAQEAADQLRPAMEASYKEFVEQKDLQAAVEESAAEDQHEIPADEIPGRIEDEFIKEPELQKPERKARPKAKKAK